MIGVFLASLGYGGDFGNLLSQLEQLGFFAYVLPFLVVFAIVFGVLSNVGVLGNNKALNAVIAISVGLMALQFGIVTAFFGEIFPRLGIWLSVFLVVIILVGLFNPNGKWPVGPTILFVGIIVAIIVSQSFGQFSFDYRFASWFTDNFALIVPLAVIFGVIAWAWSSQAPQTPTFAKTVQNLLQPFDVK